ncbi:GGDEF domain-containing protein [Nocardioides carbamazepini]|uniref:GGDEF domain-containing protein n=1 Tax=Nocardioides carbamazepini TaxID=2854259 RepID=UPI00214A1AF2|nr:GGDEF domain-containing protein [Nocardioides carbamazepini]MCR1782800.1 GGDEF domain-containing protein [Nocardioides carbamazepini]
MLDTVTLRVAFGLVATCVLVLCYGVTYRSTRSAYSGWWCASLAFFIVSALLFLFNGTAAQVVANPLGNTAGVLGAACVWSGGRSLRERRVRPWQLLLVPAVVLVVSFADDPRTDIWSGGAVYLAGMAGLIGASARELGLLLRGLGAGDATRAQYRFVLTAMAVVSAVIAVFYLARTAAFVAVGPADPFFRMAFGGQVTTLLMMVLLVVVTFSMSALSHEQQTSELRLQATRDGLTGLLNRSEFLRAAQRELDRGPAGAVAAVVIADLDRFKSINDGLGHAAGDRALTTFATACQEVVGVRGLLGRLGGDEFVLLVRGAPAEAVVEEIARRYRGDDLSAMPTVSFGIATVVPGDDIALAVADADGALYEAKSAGRARAVRAPRNDDRPSSPEERRRTA